MALWTLPNRAEIFTQPSMTARNVMGGVITYLLSLAVCCGLLHMTPFCWEPKASHKESVSMLVAYALDLGGRRSEQQLEVKCA